MLRAIIHRKTHESRHMGRPLIELKKFDVKEEKIDFYPVERQIYHAIAERFLAKVNGEPERHLNCIELTAKKNFCSYSKGKAEEMHLDDDPEVTDVFQSSTYCRRLP